MAPERDGEPGRNQGSGREGAYAARILVFLALVVLVTGAPRPSLAQGPFGDSPVNLGEGSASDGSDLSAEVQDILDAAQAAMPGELQAGWAAGTAASRLPDRDNPGSFYDMLFVAWVDADVAGLESRMAEADGDRVTVFTRWGSVEVLRSATGQMNDLSWRWAEGGLALGVEVRTLAEREVTEPYVAAIADAMHDAAGGNGPPTGDDNLSTIIGVLVALGVIGAGSALAKRFLGRKPKPKPRPYEPTERVLTDVLGRRHTYVRDEQGRWINPETGGQLDESLWDEYNRNLPGNQAFIERERQKQAARDTAFDRAMDQLVEDQKQQASDLHAVQQMARSLLFNPDRSGLWRGPGEPGDAYSRLKELREQLTSGQTVDRRKLDAVRRLYRDHSQGKVLSEEDIPSDMDQAREVLTGTIEGTLREAITGQDSEGRTSWRGMGLRLLANVATAGHVELVLTPIESLYTMHGYVERGGDSALEGFVSAAGDVVKGELFSWAGEAGARRLFGGVKVPGKVEPQLPRAAKPRAPSAPRYVGANVDMRPHLAGMPDANVRHAQRVAQKNNVQILVRPTNPEAKALIEKGLARPKPMAVKNKTISALDTYLGAGTEDLGKVGHFKPNLPPKAKVPPELYEKVKQRYVQRLNEFRDQAEHIRQLQAKGKVVQRNGVLYEAMPDGSPGKPFSGDHDLFEILDANGNPCPESLKQHVLKELKQPPFEAQHGAHMDWDYGHYSQTPGPGGAQSAQDVARGIDQTIRGSHAPGKEPLIRFGPGTQNSISGSYYTGG